MTDYLATGALSCPVGQTNVLAEDPTRLAKVLDTMQERLINWGYAICDAAMRVHLIPNAPNAGPPAAFPYAAAGVG